MNIDGEEYQHIKAFACKVTHHINHPDMCNVGDKVGGNSCQKGDGHIGGTLYLCERNHINQSKTSNKDKRFTLMGLTTLTGKHLMCYLIFKDAKCYHQMEHRIVFTVTVNSNSENQINVNNNIDHGEALFEPLAG